MYKGASSRWHIGSTLVAGMRSLHCWKKTQPNENSLPMKQLRTTTLFCIWNLSLGITGAQIIVIIITSVPRFYAFWIQWTLYNNFTHLRIDMLTSDRNPLIILNITSTTQLYCFHLFSPGWINRFPIHFLRIEANHLSFGNSEPEPISLSNITDVQSYSNK